MKKIVSLLCLLALIATFSPASAESWQSVGTDSEGYEWMYDFDTLLSDGTGHYTVTFAKVHPKKKTWFKGDLSIMPLRRLASLNRWEEHKIGKSKYSYWTYDYKLKAYSANTMYESLGVTIVSLSK